MTAAAGVRPPLSHLSVAIGPETRGCVAALGDAILDAGPVGWCQPLTGGDAVARETFVRHLGEPCLDALVVAGLAVVDDDLVWLAFTVVEVAGRLAVIPKAAWGDEIVYLGPDSAHLAEAVLRLAPTGARAADLGTGTGLLAALIAGRYRTVVATDLAPSVVAAADLTLALNRFPDGHRAGAIVTDVAGGLRVAAFDLVAANSPWVPLADESEGTRDLFAHGGDVGIELPARFLRDGAALLRPGGIAITLALDVTLADPENEAEIDRDLELDRPLAGIVAELEAEGFVVAVLPTPFNRERPHLLGIVHGRQPRIVAATHVAVVVARPRHPGDARGSLLVAVEALRRRWATVAVSPEATAAAAGP